MSQIDYVRMLIICTRARAQAARRDGRSELGASALEWAIISALVAGLAVAIGIKITQVVTDKTNQINGG
ncbi:MAG: hypothetical protein ACR2KL_01460 [Nocardioidaceae bacterium]